MADEERRLLKPAKSSRAFTTLIATLAIAAVALTAAHAFAADSSTAQQSTSGQALKAPTTYGLWVLAPAIAAIFCAVITRQVVPALLIGIIVAAAMLLPCADPATSYGGSNQVVRVARITIETYVIGALLDGNHVRVILFSLIIGGMVGVIGGNGGTRAMVDRIAHHASTRQRVQITAWLAGLLVFFDDYANSMIVGPTMQPICDRLKVSRAKLAYIVDSTAAPVASIALIGTWVGAEIGYIQDGLDAVGRTGHLPAYLAGIDGWGAFVKSLPYRFYPILALVLVFLIAASGRDFGPMRRHETKASLDDSAGGWSALPAARAGGWWLAAIPVLTLVVVTMVILLWPGLANPPEGKPITLRHIMDNADAYASILYGAISSAVAAIFLTVLERRGSLKESIDWLTDGMSRMFPAIIVLILAWALSSASQALEVGQVVQTWLKDQQFAFNWLPTVVFSSAAIVSFATGTSWGTMGILCPMVVQVAAGLGDSVPADQALPLFYGSVGAVLAGSVFGDHCSPISDTTVLSSIASGCSLEDHVWTQIPYALIVAAVGLLAGDLLCAKMGMSPWIGIAAGAFILLIVIRGFARPPQSIL